MKYSVRTVKHNQTVRTIKRLVAGVGFEPTTFGPRDCDPVSSLYRKNVPEVNPAKVEPEQAIKYTLTSYGFSR
jgi:hypothetical protein